MNLTDALIVIGVSLGGLLFATVAVWHWLIAPHNQTKVQRFFYGEMKPKPRKESR